MTEPVCASAPIGVFDSGVGGLSVLAAIRAELPTESLLYLADSAHAPYGDKSEAQIARRARACVAFLIEHGAKAIVVACNTATVAAVTQLRAEFELPIVAMEPGIKPAVRMTRSGVVGVLATAGTVRSQRFQALLVDHASGVDVVAQACPGLVEQVERGVFSAQETRALLNDYLQPLVCRGVDTLVLGCTHYPFLTATIQALVGAETRVVDTGPAVAMQLRRRLEALDLTAVAGVVATVRYFTTGSVAGLRQFLATIGCADCVVEFAVTGA
ncbi:MAG: glutamate racemase [Thiotrichales bacterium]